MLELIIGIILDFFIELEELEVILEFVIEEVEGVMEDDIGEVFFLMERVLINLFFRDFWFCMDGGLFLKNKLFYRGGNKVIRLIEDIEICFKYDISLNSCIENYI